LAKILPAGRNSCVELRQETSFIECGNSLAHEYIPSWVGKQNHKASAPPRSLGPSLLRFYPQKSEPGSKAHQRRRIGKTSSDAKLTPIAATVRNASTEGNFIVGAKSSQNSPVTNWDEEYSMIESCFPKVAELEFQSMGSFSQKTLATHSFKLPV
jgi:hypothetical protein